MELPIIINGSFYYSDRTFSFLDNLLKMFHSFRRKEMLSVFFAHSCRNIFDNKKFSVIFQCIRYSGFNHCFIHFICCWTTYWRQSLTGGSYQVSKMDCLIFVPGFLTGFRHFLVMVDPCLVNVNGMGDMLALILQTQDSDLLLNKGFYSKNRDGPRFFSDCTMA